ncbi:tetratricopeptide repeat protein [Gelatiniphilus marinus]|uniref:Tetratricopeptide repeat protein n=1 Tax=Gelatiniphilus marinus TaxID=1759464 RepID=A0ABW5JN53_9FLAO
MKKLYVLIFITLIPIITFGQAKKLYRQATRATNPKEKIELFTQVIALEPKNLDAYFYRGIAKNDVGDYSGAILDYTKILFYKPDADSYYNRGNSKYNLQDYLGAKLDYEQALKLDPQFIDAQYNLASTKYFLEDYMGAITDLSKIIEVAPTESKAYTQRANALLALRKYKLALQDFSMAVLTNPNANTYYNRGLTHLNINYYKQAKKDFDRSLNFDANNDSAYFFRGASHLLLGKYTKAISDFNTTLKYNASDYEAILGLAIAYHKINDTQKAKLNLKKAKSLLSDFSEESQSINLFSDTYWYKNQFYFFKQNLEALNNI